MKPIGLLSLCFLVLIALTGCESMNFSQYTGAQQTWPTGSSFTDKVLAVPIYRGWPENPYDVLGVVQFGNPNTDWNEGDLKQAARSAKAAGGDAIILLPKGNDPSPKATAMRAQLGIGEKQTAALVVKWK